MQEDYGIFSEMHLAEIIAVFEDAGYLVKFHRLTSRIHKKWMVYIKKERSKGMPSDVYRATIPFTCRLFGDDLMDTVRAVAFWSYAWGAFDEAE